MTNQNKNCKTCDGSGQIYKKIKGGWLSDNCTDCYWDDDLNMNVPRNTPDNECDDGHCVMYSDHLKAVEELKKELDLFSGELELQRGMTKALVSEQAGIIKQLEAKNQRLVEALNTFCELCSDLTANPESWAKAYNMAKQALKDNKEK